jgi:hypothetical protein
VGGSRVEGCRAQALAQGAPGRVHLRDEDLPRPFLDRGQDDGLADGPASDHQDLLAGADPGPPDGVERNGQGLNQAP